MIEIIAHRGLSGLEPENTMRSFRRAVDSGANGLEVDIRITRDGVPVIIHDATVKRTSNGRGRVSKMTLKQLRLLDFGNGESIPTLEDVLKEFGAKVFLHLEVKFRVPVAPIVSMVEKMNLHSDVCISSFSHKLLREVKNLNPHITTAALFRKPRRRMTKYLHRLGVQAAHIYFHKSSKGLVDALHRAGLKIRVYRIVDEISKIKKSLLWKVDGIMIDRPDVLVKLLKQNKKYHIKNIKDQK
jgi:glycerophosphoryl diester phosphodiesterase